jgi:hypothetical protein
MGPEFDLIRWRWSMSTSSSLEMAVIPSDIHAAFA